MHGGATGAVYALGMQRALVRRRPAISTDEPEASKDANSAAKDREGFDVRPLLTGYRATVDARIDKPVRY